MTNSLSRQSSAANSMTNSLNRPTTAAAATTMNNNNNTNSLSRPTTITNWSNCGTNSAEKRPKPVFFWNNADVMKWMKRHCEQYYGLYGNAFLENEITGRSLVRMTDSTLERMGIADNGHRDDIQRIILKLKLKSDIIEIKDLEKKSQLGGYASSVTTGHS
ncbi:protein aveugle-like [Oppia nitens]|uniref:protein aveugle-like n=1 Tax=Oppia nitens TaxID=1686743 RepID=UPI0023DAB20D|nr:protein aveugle-like [Oppia nitens]